MTEKAKMVSLYNGGGRLTYGEALAARTVEHGQSFETDEETARLLIGSDPLIQLASEADTPEAMAATSTVAGPEPEFIGMDDMSGLKVPQLRAYAKSVGLDESGTKDELLERLYAYAAGFEDGRTSAAEGMSMSSNDPDNNPTNWANRSPSPGAPLPTNEGHPGLASSEAEPGAPPPPAGDSNEGRGQAQGTVNPPGAHEPGNTDEANAETGALQLEDLGDGGKTK